MPIRRLLPLAAALLAGGCVSYEYHEAGGGDYYSGTPRVEYRYHTPSGIYRSYSPYVDPWIYSYGWSGWYGYGGYGYGGYPGPYAYGYGPGYGPYGGFWGWGPPYIGVYWQDRDYRRGYHHHTIDPPYVPPPVTQPPPTAWQHLDRMGVRGDSMPMPRVVRPRTGSPPMIAPPSTPGVQTLPPTAPPAPTYRVPTPRPTPVYRVPSPTPTPVYRVPGPTPTPVAPSGSAGSTTPLRPRLRSRTVDPNSD